MVHPRSPARVYDYVIRTRLFRTFVASVRRALKPVLKKRYAFLVASCHFIRLINPFTLLKSLVRLLCRQLYVRFSQMDKIRPTYVNTFMLRIVWILTKGLQTYCESVLKSIIMDVITFNVIALPQHYLIYDVISYLFIYIHLKYNYKPDIKTSLLT